MLDYLKAKSVFNNFIDEYDKKNGKINLKLVHTYGVVDAIVYIAKDLKLDEEDIELAKIIALLHDIGRFEQAKRYGNFVDYETLNHADYGVKLLFDNNFIRKFIEDDKYDDIIEKAIRNHNKYAIEEGLNERELLHAKLIRDADKTDNIRVKATEELKYIANGLDEKYMETDLVSEKIYNEFMSKKTIISKERETSIDMWVSYIAFIFDFNFSSGLKYIKEKDYINVLVDRIIYKNNDTKKKMENIRAFANDYIEERCKEN